jgi:hypothetical protein
LAIPLGIFDVKLNRFPDETQRFIAAVPRGDLTWQCLNRGQRPSGHTFPIFLAAGLVEWWNWR